MNTNLDWGWATSNTDDAHPNAGNFSAKGSSVGFSDIRSGIKQPYWRRTANNLQSATSVYSRTITRNDPLPIYGNGALRDAGKPRSPGFGFYVTGTLKNVLSDPSALSYSSALSQSQVSALASFFNQANGDVSGIVFAGEIRETMRMFLHPCSSLVKLSLNFYNARRGLTGKQLAKVISDLYLTWTYGAVPLMADMAGINKALLSLTRQELIRHDHGSKTVTEKTLSPLIRTQGAGGFTFRYLERSSVEASTQIGGGRLIKSTEMADVLSTYFGFNLASVPSALWDLIPFSFVVDYITNVGDIMSVLGGTAQHHYYVYMSSKVTLSTEVVSSAVTLGKSGYTTLRSTGTISGRREKIIFGRSPALPSLGSLDLIPSFEAPNIKQLVNLAALVTAYKTRNTRF